MDKRRDRFGWIEIPGREKGIPMEKGKDAFSCLASADENYYEGFFEDALRQYSMALKYNKGLIAAWSGQVRCLIEMDELAEAETWVNNALTYFPHSSDLLAIKGLIMAKLYGSDEAMVYSDRSFEQQSETGYPWISRGEILLYADRRKNANVCFDQIILQNPEEWRVHVDIGKVFLHHKQFNKAIYYFSKALEMNPSNAYTWFLSAKCYRGMHLRSRSKSAVKTALEIRRSFPEAQKFLDSLSLKPCFVATACYGNDSAPEVAALRRWRDEFLEVHPAGRIFLSVYYIAGPIFAKPVGRYAVLSAFARYLLSRFVRIIKKEAHGD